VVVVVLVVVPDPLVVVVCPPVPEPVPVAEVVAPVVVVVVPVLPPPVEVPLHAATAATERRERIASARKVEVCMEGSLHQKRRGGGNGDLRRGGISSSFASSARLRPGWRRGSPSGNAR